jgi:hypothetical protein
MIEPPDPDLSTAPAKSDDFQRLEEIAFVVGILTAALMAMGIELETLEANPMAGEVWFTSPQFGRRCCLSVEVEHD